MLKEATSKWARDSAGAEHAKRAVARSTVCTGAAGIGYACPVELQLGLWIQLLYDGTATWSAKLLWPCVETMQACEKKEEPTLA